MALSARTTIRSGVLMQVADYIFSTTMDALRLLVVPFLPEGVQRRLGVRQYGFPPAQLQELNNAPVPALEAQAEQALQPDDVPPEEAAIFAAMEAPAEDAPQAEGNPASWRWRFELLGKKVWA
ncbi:g1899 [Coccomyxa elongata]